MQQNKTTVILQENNNNVVAISREFRNEYLDLKNNPILLEQPVLVSYLLFAIIKDLSIYNFQRETNQIIEPKKRQPNQLKFDFWNNTIVNNNKNEILKSYRTSTFLKNRDKKQMTYALEFLKTYKAKPYTFTNDKNQIITTSGGLIKDWYYLDKTGDFQITISLHWAHLIVSHSFGDWSNLNLNVFKQFKNNRQRYFVLWLINITLYQGVTPNWEKMQKTYDLNYTRLDEFIRNFLHPIKRKLEENSVYNNWISFNCNKVEGNNSLIQIVPYHVKPRELVKYSIEQINEKEKLHTIYTKNTVSYKLKYIKRRHLLTDSNEQQIKEYISNDLSLFEQKYKLFIQQAKIVKKKATDFTGTYFLDAIQEQYRIK